MGRSARQLPDGCSFPITLRCNSRAFLIARGVRKVFHDPYRNDGYDEGLAAVVARSPAARG